MAAERAKRDTNRVPVMLGVTNDASLDPTELRMDPATLRLLVNAIINGATFDGSGNLNVNVQAGGGGGAGGDGAINDGVSSSIKATVLDYINSNPLAVRLSDTNGDYVAAGAGTQYTEDAAAAADPIGGMSMGRRRDTLVTNEVSADGDNIALNATNKGQLHVKLADTVVVDGSGVTQPISAASLPLPSGAATSAKQDTGNTSLAAINSDTTAIAASASVLDDWDESDRAKVNTIAGQAGVQGGSGAVSANTQRVVLATDVALPSGTNAIGKLSANSGVDIGDVDVTSIIPGAGATNLGKAEDAAHSSGDIGVAAWGVSNENLTPFAAASGDYIPQAANRYGHQYVTAPVPSHASSNGTPISSTATSVVAAPSAGNHLRVSRIHISNGGSTATWVAVRDGAAGTQHYRTYLPQGGVMSLNLNNSGPLDLTTATRLDIVLSAAGSVEYEIDYLTVAD